LRYALLLFVFFFLAPTPIYTTYSPIIAKPCRQPQRGYAYAWSNYNGNVTAYPCNGWFYNWTARRPSQNYGMEFVPMIQCKQFKHKTWPNDDVEDLAVNYGYDYAGHVLVLNEPDWTQCPLSPEEAAAFIDDMAALFPNARLVGPNVTQNGTAWLAQFADAYDGRPLAAIGLHSYSFDGFNAQPQARLDDAIAILDGEGWLDVEIWVTEFGTDDAAKMMEYMDVYQNVIVKRVAYFAPIVPRDQPGLDKWPYPESSLFDEDTGEITAIGKIFLNE